jgi:hypothetical protein
VFCSDSLKIESPSPMCASKTYLLFNRYDSSWKPIDIFEMKCLHCWFSDSVNIVPSVVFVPNMLLNQFIKNTIVSEFNLERYI